MRHYSTVVKPESLYAAQFLALSRKEEIEELEIKRKPIRKILGSQKIGDEQRKRSNYTQGKKELYLETVSLSETIRKRRIAFCGHLATMSQERLTKRNYKNRKTKFLWFIEVKKNRREEINISEDKVLDNFGYFGPNSGNL